VFIEAKKASFRLAEKSAAIYVIYSYTHAPEKLTT